MVASAKLNVIQDLKQDKGSDPGRWAPPVVPAVEVTFTQLNVTHIVPDADTAVDLVTRLRQSRLGSLYVRRLKRFSVVRRTVGWSWRHGYPLYIKLKLSLEATARHPARPMVRFGDYASHATVENVSLVPEQHITVSNPPVFPAADVDVIHSAPPDYRFPEVRVVAVRGALVYGTTNMVICNGSVLCHDLYDFSRDLTSEELHGRIRIKPSKRIVHWLLRDIHPSSLPKAAVFTDACAGNYAHWLTEVLPRIVLFCADERFQDVPIVVNDGLHPNIMESLLLVVGSKRSIVTLATGRAIAVDLLYVTSPTGYVPFDRRSSRRPTLTQGVFHPQALRSMRQKIVEHITEPAGVEWPERIYLRRNSGTRRLINGAEVEKALVTQGFVVVEPETLTFQQQVMLFSHAKEIVSPTGAGCANIVFCSPGTRFVVLMAKHEDMPYRYWLHMGAPLGVKVGYVIGEIDEVLHLGIHGDFSVRLADLEAALVALGGEKIHPTAVVAPGARLGTDVEIGPFTVVHDNVVIGDRVRVGAYCELGIATPLGDGSPLCIGDDAMIRSHSVFYEASSFAPGLVTGHHVTVRENTRAGCAFQIGTLCEIQGDCEIGNYVRFQSNVFVGKKTRIGDYVWILPYVVLANDPTPPSNQLIGCVIEDFAALSAGSVILPGVTVSQHALVAAAACVTKDVPPGKVVAGVPARVMGDAHSIIRRDGSGEPAYPWTRHFHRGYPPEVVEKWLADTEVDKGKGKI